MLFAEYAAQAPQLSLGMLLRVAGEAIFCICCIGGQRSNVGMLPPSDSEDDEDEAKGDGEAAEAKPSKASSSKGQSKNAGKLPPSGSEEEDDDDDESEEESSEEPLNEYLASSAPRKK